MAISDFLESVNATANGVSPFIVRLITEQDRRRRDKFKLDDIKAAQKLEDKERRLKFLRDNVDDPEIRPQALEAFGIEPDAPQFKPGTESGTAATGFRDIVPQTGHDLELQNEFDSEARRLQSARRLQNILGLSGANVGNLAGKGVIDVPGLSRAPVDVAQEDLVGDRRVTEQAQAKTEGARFLTEQERAKSVARRAKGEGQRAKNGGFNVRRKLSDLENFQRETATEIKAAFKNATGEGFAIQRVLSGAAGEEVLSPSDKVAFETIKALNKRGEELLKLERVYRGFKTPSSVEEIADWFEKGYLSEREALELDRKFPKIPETSKKKG